MLSCFLHNANHNEENELQSDHMNKNINCPRTQSFKVQIL